MREPVVVGEDHTLHCIMAGNGNPYRYLTPLRKRLLAALHLGVDRATLQQQFGLSEEDLLTELTPLVAASLVREQAGTFAPTFFIADAAETTAVVHHARQAGHALAAYCLNQWQQLEQIYLHLVPNPSTTFAAQAFMLVGARLLDVGVLDALARDRTLMPPAPARPSPDQRAARYYFWMITGSPEHLGRYGQRATTLPWDRWQLLTFGQYELNGQPNEHRNQLEATVRAWAARADCPDAFALAAAMAIPSFTAQQTQQWTAAMQPHADAITMVYQQQHATVRSLFAGLRAGGQQQETFGEFFCWYHHLAYAHAIDQLVAHENVVMPAQRYTAAIWCEAFEQSAF